MNRLYLAMALLAASLCLPGAAAAQDGQQQAAGDLPMEIQKAKPVEAPISSTPYIDGEAMPDTEVTVMQDKFAGSPYVTPSMENLSRLYWRLGIFTTGNKKAIDNYLIINECDIYKNFFSDDFEWNNIRKSTAEMLKEKSPAFTNQFKILVPIDLGRYDMKKGGFDIVSGTAFENSRRIQVTSGVGGYKGCDQQGDLDGYPSQVILILNKPFTFDFVKVDEHVAQAFLLRKKYNRTPVPRELRNKGFQRLAFARMRVTFARFQGVVQDNRNVAQAVLYGKLDGIDVFEDLNEEMLLTSISYQ